MGEHSALERLTTEERVVLQALRCTDHERRQLIIELVSVLAANALAAKPKNVIDLAARRR